MAGARLCPARSRAALAEDRPFPAQPPRRSALHGAAAEDEPSARLTLAHPSQEIGHQPQRLLLRSFHLTYVALGLRKPSLVASPDQREGGQPRGFTARCDGRVAIRSTSRSPSPSC